MPTPSTLVPIGYDESRRAVAGSEESPTMPSPFPGMAPYLEQEVTWHDFHERFHPAAAARISAQVLPRYIVLIDESVYVRDVELERASAVGRPDLTAARGSDHGSSFGVAGAVLEAPAQVWVPE